MFVQSGWVMGWGSWTLQFKLLQTEPRQQRLHVQTSFKILWVTVLISKQQTMLCPALWLQQNQEPHRKTKLGNLRLTCMEHIGTRCVPCCPIIPQQVCSPGEEKYSNNSVTKANGPSDCACGRQQFPYATQSFIGSFCSVSLLSKHHF